MGVLCVFAAALIFSGCSEDINTFGPDHILDVSGTWRYEAEAVKGDCTLLFCSECHYVRDDGIELDCK